MITADLVLRIIAALLESQAELLKKATPEQVQALIDRYEARIAGFEKLLHRVMPDFGQ